MMTMGGGYSLPGLVVVDERVVSRVVDRPEQQRHTRQTARVSLQHARR